MLLEHLDNFAAVVAQVRASMHNESEMECKSVCGLHIVAVPDGWVAFVEIDPEHQMLKLFTVCWLTDSHSTAATRKSSARPVFCSAGTDESAESCCSTSSACER